eukprot:6526166-Pyramimonas_sp.AAC.1
MGWPVLSSTTTPARGPTARRCGAGGTGSPTTSVYSPGGHSQMMILTCQSRPACHRTPAR